jgi:hypothetical protein
MNISCPKPDFFSFLQNNRPQIPVEVKQPLSAVDQVNYHQLLKHEKLVLKAQIL